MLRSFSLNSREAYETVCAPEERAWIPNGALPRPRAPPAELAPHLSIRSRGASRLLANLGALAYAAQAESPPDGSGQMDTWESFFREKSKRRWSLRSRETIVKRGILVLLFGGLAVAIALLAAGWPR